MVLVGEQVVLRSASSPGTDDVMGGVDGVLEVCNWTTGDEIILAGDEDLLKRRWGIDSSLALRLFPVFPACKAKGRVGEPRRLPSL